MVVGKAEEGGALEVRRLTLPYCGRKLATAGPTPPTATLAPRRQAALLPDGLRPGRERTGNLSTVDVSPSSRTQTR